MRGKIKNVLLLSPKFRRSDFKSVLMAKETSIFKATLRRDRAFIPSD